MRPAVGSTIDKVRGKNYLRALSRWAPVNSPTGKVIFAFAKSIEPTYLSDVTIQWPKSVKQVRLLTDPINLVVEVPIDTRVLYRDGIYYFRCSQNPLVRFRAKSFFNKHARRQERLHIMDFVEQCSFDSRWFKMKES